MRLFKIPGMVRAKQRPRLGRGRVYTPQETINYECLVRNCYYDCAKNMGWKPIDGPIRVELEVFFPIPKSDSKKKKSLKLSGSIRPTIKPDVDNIAKSILDALNGLAYADDKQVVDCRVGKYYGDDPSVYVKIIELGA